MAFLAIAPQAIRGSGKETFRSVHGSAVQNHASSTAVWCLNKTVNCDLCSRNVKLDRSGNTDFVEHAGWRMRRHLLTPRDRNSGRSRNHPRGSLIQARTNLVECSQVQQSTASLALHSESNCLERASFSEANSRSRPQLHQWLQKFICEIVANVKDAPIIHFIFDATGCSPGRTERQRISKDELNLLPPWSTIKLHSLTPESDPDGLIFVERLDSESAVAESCLANVIETERWGVLVLGKNVAGSSACYILKTTRVPSGLGITCTSFCLTKARCFGASWHEQLRSAWLVSHADRHPPPPPPK